MTYPYHSRIMARLPGQEAVELCRLNRHLTQPEINHWTRDMAPEWQCWTEHHMPDSRCVSPRINVDRVSRATYVTALDGSENDALVLAGVEQEYRV